MYSRFDGRERTTAVSSDIAVAVDGLLLREPEGRDLPRQPVHVRFGLCLQGIFQLDLLLSQLRAAITISGKRPRVQYRMTYLFELA